MSGDINGIRVGQQSEVPRTAPTINNTSKRGEDLLSQVQELDKFYKAPVEVTFSYMSRNKGAT